MLDRRDDTPDLSKAHLPIIPLRYDSRSELALCRLFEAYIPNWKAVMGDTFQVPIGSNRTIDFRIDNTLLEYHPIMINREMKSSHANHIFRQLYARSNKWERLQLTELLVEELSAQYTHRRAQLVAASALAKCQLVVCGNVEEVYKLIMLRYGNDVPKLAEFKSRFYQHLK